MYECLGAIHDCFSKPQCHSYPRSDHSLSSPRKRALFFKHLEWDIHTYICSTFDVLIPKSVPTPRPLPFTTTATRPFYSTRSRIAILPCPPSRTNLRFTPHPYSISPTCYKISSSTTTQSPFLNKIVSRNSASDVAYGATSISIRPSIGFIHNSRRSKLGRRAMCVR